MFQFVEFEFPNKYKFIAFGNSIHAIALSIQRGFFPKDSIQLYPASESGIYVSFLNNSIEIDKWKFEPNEYYHLIWHNNIIDLYYKYDHYIPSYCIPDLTEEIKNDTWEIIYGKYFKHLIPEKIDDEIQFNYEEEIMSQTEEECDYKEEYDINYNNYYEDERNYYEYTDDMVLYKKQKYELHDEKPYSKKYRYIVDNNL
jgi:hypothetical protein